MWLLFKEEINICFCDLSQTCGYGKNVKDKNAC